MGNRSFRCRSKLSPGASKGASEADSTTFVLSRVACNLLHYLHHMIPVLSPSGCHARTFPFPSHSRLATSVADPIIMSPKSRLSPPYGPIDWASEALAVLVVVEPVPVLVLVEVVELEVAAAVAGREESFASVYNHCLLVNFFSSNRTWGLEQ